MGLTFTNDELAYLKAEIPHNDSMFFQYANRAFRLDALIARLEAAERMCSYIGNVPDLENMDWFREGDKLFQAWREAAGKGKP